MARGSRRNANGHQMSKAHLPSKPCAACGRPFTWRRKWARDWPEIRFCSERCRRQGAAHQTAPQVSP